MGKVWTIGLCALLIFSRSEIGAADFEGRVSPRHLLHPIVLEAFDISGGRHIESARTAVTSAIENTSTELSEHLILQEDIKQRTTMITSRRDELRQDSTRLQHERNELQEELSILTALRNPSRAVQDCILELEGDIAQLVAQLENIEQALVTLDQRREFLAQTSRAAYANETRLREALRYLKDSYTALADVTLPRSRPGLLQPKNFGSAP